MKKFLSLLLAFVMVTSIFAMPTFAVEKDIAEVGAPTQAEAINWLYSVVGKTQGNGQCVALVRAYYSYLGVAPVSGSGSDYATNSLPQSDAGKWERIPYSSSLDVQPGDIIAWSWTNAGGNDGHVAIIVEDNANVLNAKMVTQNPGPPAIQKVSWAGTSIACVIRPKFGNHTHSYDTYAWYEAAHPHYKAYKCSCGDVKANYSQTTYLSNCSKCVLSNVHMSCSKKALPVGEANTFTFGATNATSYLIGINRNGQRIITEEVTSGKSYTFDQAGNYTAYVTCHSNAGGGNKDSNVVSFTVFEPVVLGDVFTANIVNAKTNKMVSGNNSNVELQSKSNSDSQKWLFELQTDNSYKITNIALDKCMDVLNYETANGTNIGLHPDNSSTAQRYYLRETNIGYSLVPKCNTSGAIDVANDSHKDGTNIQEWDWNGDAYQSFSIDCVDLLPSKTVDFNGHKYEYYDFGLSWEQAYKYCEKMGGHLVTISDKVENDFVHSLASQFDNTYCWLGATDLAKADSFYWVTGEPMSYTNWSDSEPNNTNNSEFYIEMYVNVGTISSWNDSDSAPLSHIKTNGFICEYEEVESNEYTYSKTFKVNDHTYEVYDIGVNYQTARKICEAKGGHLVVLDDANEESIVLQNIQDTKQDEYWLGISDLTLEGEWVDIYGNSLVYTNWQSGEPNDDMKCEDYAVVIKSSEVWIDLKGFSFAYRPIGFICEYEPEEPEMLIGDVNGDGDINIMDATEIQRHIAQLSTIPEDRLSCADANKDGQVNIMDATQIQRFIAQLIPSL